MSSNLALAEVTSSNVVGMNGNGNDWKLANGIRNLYSAASKAKQQRVAQWDRNWKLLNNKVWPDTRAQWLPAPALSEIMPIIASIVAWQTDQRPQIRTVPQVDLNAAYATDLSGMCQDMETCIDASWQAHLFEAECEKVCWDSGTFGTGIYKSLWDNTLCEGLGDISMRRVDPYTFYPDPQASSMEDANYFLEVRTMALQEVDRRWPGSAKYLNEMYETDTDRRPDLYQNTGQSPMANPAALPGGTQWYGLPGQAHDHVYMNKGVTVIEAWLRETEIIRATAQEKKADPNAADKVHDQWRCVIIAGNLVLFNELAIDLWNHGRHPYSRQVFQDMGEFWGISLVEHLAPLQLAINRLLAAIQMNAELCGNPVWLEDTRSNIQRTAIVNKPGQRISKSPGSETGWAVPPPMSADVPQLIQFYLHEMERISGLSAISRGMSPQGRNAADVLDAIQEAGFVRVRLSLRNMERALMEQGNLLASLVVENYTGPRIVSIVGPDGERTVRQLNGKHFYVPSMPPPPPPAEIDPQTGQPKPQPPQPPPDPMPLSFKIRIEAGSSLATAATARKQEVGQLFGLGVIDRQAVLDTINFPNRAAILQRMMQAEQQAQLAGQIADQKKKK